MVAIADKSKRRASISRKFSSILKRNLKGSPIGRRRNDGRLKEKTFDENLFSFLLERTWDDDERLTEVVLDGWKIGDDRLVLLAEALANNTNITILSLRDNDITAEGCYHLSLALEQNMSICRVWLDDNNVGHAGVESIVRALDGNTSILELGLSRTGIESGGAHVLAKALKRNLDINIIHLDGNDINDDAIEEDISVSLSSRSSRETRALFIVEPGAYDDHDKSEELLETPEGMNQSSRNNSFLGDEDYFKDVKRLGVLYNPPIFFVEYKSPDGEIFHKKIFLKSLNAMSKPEKVSEALIRAHDDCLSKVPYSQVLRLVTTLVKNYDNSNCPSTETPSIDEMLTASIHDDVTTSSENKFEFLGLREAMQFHQGVVAENIPHFVNDSVSLEKEEIDPTSSYASSRSSEDSCFSEASSSSSKGLFFEGQKDLYPGTSKNSQRRSGFFSLIRKNRFGRPSISGNNAIRVQ